MKKLPALFLFAMTVANAANIIIQNDSSCKFVHSGNISTPGIKRHTAPSVISPHSSGMVNMDFTGSYNDDYTLDLFITSCDSSRYIYLSVGAFSSGWEAALESNRKVHLSNMSFKEDDSEICGGSSFKTNKVVLVDKS
ncbi:MAG: hypothetical protein VX335_02805 [Pseudomonadota bacterium]|nr:hypothetical protein [Pseudomonadota bacterium]